MEIVLKGMRTIANQLQSIVGDLGVERFGNSSRASRVWSLQPPEKQGRFKLSYDCDALGLQELTDRLVVDLQRLDAPYRVIASVDPFTGGGLIDLLPRRCSKAYAFELVGDQHDAPVEGDHVRGRFRQ